MCIVIGVDDCLFAKMLFQSCFKVVSVASIFRHARVSSTYPLGLAEMGQNGPKSKNIPFQLYSYVKLNFKAGLFSSTF